MKKNIILFILIIYVLSAFSQKPSGYLGKRFNLSYSGLTFMPLVYLGKEDKNFINYTHSLNLEWAIKQNKSVGLRYQRFNTKGYINTQTTNVIPYNSSSGYTSNYITDSYDLTANVFAIDYIFYKKGWISPLGKFKKLSIMWINYSSTNYLKNNEYVINTVDKVSDYKLAFTYSVGKRWIFNDIFTVHIASQVGLSLPYTSILDIISNNYNNFEKGSDVRMFSYMIYNFEIGTGILF